jgi:hypothetical protein
MTVEYVNHNDYPDLGTPCNDVKRRLRVYIGAEGTKRYHCYKCGQDGFVYGKIVAKPQPKVVPDKPVNGVSIPLDKRVWLYKYGITDQEIDVYKIRYSPKDDAIVLQIYDDHGLAMQQLRYLGESKIKYKTIPCRANLKHKPMFITKSTAKTLVLTEDILSAIKVSRLEGVVGVSLLGTSISPAQVMMLKQLKVEQAYVYLDNDNAVVKRQQVRIKKLLDNYLNCDTKIVRVGKDPKELTVTELKQIVR